MTHVCLSCLYRSEPAGELQPGQVRAAVRAGRISCKECILQRPPARADAARLLSDAESYARMIGLVTQLLPAWQPMLAEELASTGCPVHAMRVDQLAGCVLRVLERAGRRLP